MRILFITSDYLKPECGTNIYTDLAKVLNERNHIVKVVVPEEKKKIDKTTLFVENDIPVLRVKTGNIYEVGLVEKTMTFIRISNDLIGGIKEYFRNETFDLILFQSPPLTMCNAVKWAMKKYNAKSYLMMKDIFPQNALDIGLFTKKNPMYWYFKNEEKKLYKTASKIGCMSQGNIDYLLNNNKFLDKNKMEIFPNAAIIDKKDKITRKEYLSLREKYYIDKNDVVCVYSGNFGRPQGLDFFVEVLDKYKNKKNIKFLLVGRGTEKNKIFNYVKMNNFNNILMFDFIPRVELEKLLRVCDIGMIFLDKRFTIPNFPSKTLSYMECSLPIIAGIDVVTDFGKMIEKAGCGFWTESGNLKDFSKKFENLIKNKKTRIKMGNNGRKYYEENYDISKSVKILERFMEENKNEYI